MLDIHAASSSQGDPGEPFEILEAGTGHGSLTLHLSRAINGANSCPPPIPIISQQKVISGGSTEKRTSTSLEEQITDDIGASQEAWDSWRAERRAIIHTVEISAKHSSHAEKIVRGFRRGIYAGNVDFYVASVENWIEDQVRQRQRSLVLRSTKPFLSHAILDMPSAHLRIPHVSPILKVDGLLAVFMPNVTQIGDCVKIIREQRLPLVLEKAVELGTGISSGRLWDIRMAVRKSKPKVREMDQVTQDSGEDASLEDAPKLPTQDAATTTLEDAQVGEPVLVCRPKVGERIVGGGFVGLWRRIKAD